MFWWFSAKDLFFGGFLAKFQYQTPRSQPIIPPPRDFPGENVFLTQLSNNFQFSFFGVKIAVGKTCVLKSGGGEVGYRNKRETANKNKQNKQKNKKQKKSTEKKTKPRKQKKTENPPKNPKTKNEKTNQKIQKKMLYEAPRRKPG